MQSVPQLMPLGVLVTVPVPVLLTVKVAGTGAASVVLLNVSDTPPMDNVVSVVVA